MTIDYDAQAHTNVATIPGLIAGFTITTEPTRYVLACKTCKARWQLPLKPPHPGNVLSLLNHAAGCAKKTVKANRKNKAALDSFFFGGPG